MTSSPAHSNQITPSSTFPAIVGAVLQSLRKDEGKDQKSVADALGLKSVSAWSKVENGDTALTVEQLVVACLELGVLPSDVLQVAEDQALSLSDRGVTMAATRAAGAASAVGVASSLPIAGASLLALAGPVGWVGAAAALAAGAAMQKGRKSKFERFKAALSPRVKQARAEGAK